MLRARGSASISTRRSNRNNSTADLASLSYLTVLRPRDYTASDIVSVFSNFFVVDENETWVHRVQLTFRILSFCLGPGNIWRFPEQSFKHGSASYIYLYIIYNLVLCIALLVFEISLSQYFVRGFAKMFSLCPLMEGITLAMTAYCIVANFMYSLIATYSIIYTFSSLQGMVLPHSHCRKGASSCIENATNSTFSPEYNYFYNHVERATDSFLGDKYNYRNACVLAFIWLFLCVVIASGSMRHHWISIAISLVILLSLLYSAIISATLTGATDGLLKMFIPNFEDIGHLTTWIYAAEQAIVTIGIGAGPLTTIWSVSKIRYWFRRDCVIVIVVAVIGSLMSGMVYFSAAGVMAKKYNMTLEDIANFPTEFHTYTLVVPMFNTLPNGMSHFTVALFYFIIFLSCFYSLLEYTQIIILYIGSYIPIKQIRVKVIIAVCVAFCFVIVNVGVTQISFPLIMAINENFIATSLLIILSFEVTSVSFFYGIYNFCDDIEFMLNFTPTLFYQVSWMIFPGLFAVASIASLYLKFEKIHTAYEIAALSLTIILSLLTIVSFAIFKCVAETRSVGFRRALNPRYSASNDSNPPTETETDQNRQPYSLYNNLYLAGH